MNAIADIIHHLPQFAPALKLIRRSVRRANRHLQSPPRSTWAWNVPAPKAAKRKR